MTRIKKGTHAIKRRRNLLKKVKGYRHGRSKKERAAREAIAHAGVYAFVHRRDKKNDFRRLWSVRISAGAQGLGLSYSKLIGGLKKKGIALDRKILSTLAEQHPETFKRVVEKIS